MALENADKAVLKNEPSEVIVDEVCQQFFVRRQMLTMVKTQSTTEKSAGIVGFRSSVPICVLV